MKEVKDLVLMCSQIGKNIELTQAGGANASVKNSRSMWIKASGFNLSDVNCKSGYVLVNHPLIRESFEHGSAESEEQSRDLIKFSILDSNGGLKPSMEVGFHSYLPRCVLHTHPIFLNSISGLSDPASLLSSLGLDDVAVVDYFRPGFNLAKQVYSSFLSLNAKGCRYPSFILRNHGLLVSGQTPKDCLEKTLIISNAAKSLVLDRTNLVLPPYSPPVPHIHDGMSGFLGSVIGDSLSGVYMFPDAVVFLEDLKRGKGKASVLDGRLFYQLSEKSSRNIDEVLYAHNHVLNYSRVLGEIKPLSVRDVEELVNMEEEKYRKRSVEE
ncbi:MAG: class II aldolase/adducin family protein [Nanoarchaeota archaeon]